MTSSEVIQCDGACGARAATVDGAVSRGWRLCTGACGDLYCAPCAASLMPNGRCTESDSDGDDGDDSGAGERYMQRLATRVPAHMRSLQERSGATAAVAAAAAAAAAAALVAAAAAPVATQGGDAWTATSGVISSEAAKQ